MRILGRTERRVVAAIVITALIPLVGSVLLARTMIARVSATAFQPEFSAQLNRSLEVYGELATAIKQSMRFEAEAIAAAEPLRRGAFAGADASRQAESEAALDAALARAFDAHPSLVSLRVEGCDGEVQRGKDRGRPVDPAIEKTLTVRRALAAEPGVEAHPEDCDAGGTPAVRLLVATFSTPSARFAEIESAQAFARTYDLLVRERREDVLDRTYANAFAALLGVTIALAVLAGVLVVRPVVRRIARLAAATRPVAEGDLSVRVALPGNDEVADLGRAFDRMLEELERSRARIEFLKRMSEWQKMARRLAHEIKNPLTPIQLAVQECHRRYDGSDTAYEQLLQTTLEVVEEEVGTLRRLVGEFSSFARLPRAELSEADLGEFLREQAAHLAAAGGPVHLEFDVPKAPMLAVIDREMLHRALTNMVQNAAQALRDDPRPRDKGEIRVSAAAEGARYVIDIDDDGPGIDPAVRDSVFDPYVTTRRDGTGLGLSIVKKIIMDHGGTIDVLDSPLGGARFEIRLPAAGTPAARAALEKSIADRGDPSEPEGPANAESRVTVPASSEPRVTRS